VWFITGASKGLGREWALAALERGDSVAAAARSSDLLDELAAPFGERVLPITLDVADREADFAAVARAHEHFGRLDVVVNNAGYGVEGAVEEVSEEEARDLFDVNFFGPLWVIQAALPFLREQGRGHILQVSSVGGQIAGASLGIYYASKWALEALSQALAQEVRRFGIKLTIIEPSGYRTDAHGRVARTAPNPAYDRLRERHAQVTDAADSYMGDPSATRDAILAVVDADDPPLRLLLGDGALQMVSAELESRLATWRAWEAVSIAAHRRPAG
jgi:NAD(P)-dependent dehydrogenase (short-subunit alcohol dehydrogenase family)